MSKVGGKAKSKRKPNKALMQKYTPQAKLAAVIGKAKISRGQAIKQVWAYIKKKKLQDAKNKRQINCGKDAALKALFGGKKSVTMFEVGKYVFPQLK